MSHNSNHYATTNQHSHDDERCQGSFVMAVPPSENDSDDDNNPPDHVVEDKLPEEKLNTMALRMSFYCRVMNGFGALALAWATVVLLGGYATLIKPKDFWLVTILIFLEATWYGSIHNILYTPSVSVSGYKMF